MVFIMDGKHLDLFLPLLKDKLLDEENRFRLLKKTGSSQMQSLASHLLSCYAITQFLNVECLPNYIAITHSPSGQPQIANRQGNSEKIYISCSHTNRTPKKNSAIIVCAISKYPIGVDIEKNRSCLERVANRMFTKKEVEYIGASNCKDKAFTELWTLREAYSKLSGLGLMKMPSVEFDLSGENSFCSDKSVFSTLLDWKNYTLAIISKFNEPVLLKEVPEADALNMRLFLQK